VKRPLLNLVILLIMTVEVIWAIPFFVLGCLGNGVVGGFRAGVEAADRLHDWMKKKLN